MPNLLNSIIKLSLNNDPHIYTRENGVTGEWEAIYVTSVIECHHNLTARPELSASMIAEHSDGANIREDP